MMTSTLTARHHVWVEAPLNLLWSSITAFLYILTHLLLVKHLCPKLAGGIEVQASELVMRLVARWPGQWMSALA